MVYIKLHSFVVLIVIDAVNISMIFFTCFTFLHCLALGAVWAYYLPKTFLCPMIVFATFVGMRDAQVVTAVTYVPTHFKFSVQQAFANFRVHFYNQVFVSFPVLKHELWLYFIFIRVQFRILLNNGLCHILRSNVFWYIINNYSGVFEC